LIFQHRLHAKRGLTFIAHEGEEVNHILFPYKSFYIIMRALASPRPDGFISENDDLIWMKRKYIYDAESESDYGGMIDREYEEAKFTNSNRSDSLKMSKLMMLRLIFKQNKKPASGLQKAKKGVHTFKSMHINIQHQTTSLPNPS
jgi:hypothetical protein